MYLADFHRRLGRGQEEFAPKEVACARQLLSRYTPAEVRDLIDYALRRARETNFDMQWFGALSLYEAQWQAERRVLGAAAERQSAVAACRFCNEHGYLEFADGSVGSCPHDLGKVARINAHKPVRGYHQA